MSAKASALDIWTPYFGIVDGGLHCYLIPVEVVAGLATISLTKYERFRIGWMGRQAGMAGTGT